MARKRQRRYFPARRGSGPARLSDSERQARLDTTAHQLANGYTLDELRALLAERTALLEQADRDGVNQPGPASLVRYHAARADWEVARRAVELASSGDSS